ncbi:hypothetical protein, partial [Ruminococcus sp.]|uniref:hypothetical protein n=1 Tax=Ruminococcus sp. TaxID=41978 RepID=UPI00386CCF2B
LGESPFFDFISVFPVLRRLPGDGVNNSGLTFLKRKKKKFFEIILTAHPLHGRISMKSMICITFQKGRFDG